MADISDQWRPIVWWKQSWSELAGAKPIFWFVLQKRLNLIKHTLS